MGRRLHIITASLYHNHIGSIKLSRCNRVFVVVSNLLVSLHSLILDIWIQEDMDFLLPLKPCSLWKITTLSIEIKLQLFRGITVYVKLSNYKMIGQPESCIMLFRYSMKLVGLTSCGVVTSGPDGANINNSGLNWREWFSNSKTFPMMNSGS